MSGWLQSGTEKFVWNAVWFIMPICSLQFLRSSKMEEFFMSKIYIKAINRWVETTKKEHDNYYKSINTYRRTQQNHGNCTCPHQKYYYCDMDCYNCKYHVSDDADSLDRMFEDADGNESRLLDTIQDENSNTETIVEDKLILDILLKRLDELMPEARKIGEMRMMGLNDTEISKEMEMPRTTMLSRLNKIKKMLGEEFPDFFENISSK